MQDAVKRSAYPLTNIAVYFVIDANTEIGLKKFGTGHMNAYNTQLFIHIAENPCPTVAGTGRDTVK